MKPFPANPIATPTTSIADLFKNYTMTTTGKLT
jgi:hypothetical protein